MVECMTRDFMLYAFVRQSERFSKTDRLIWLIFCFRFCLCICVPTFLCF